MDRHSQRAWIVGIVGITIFAGLVSTFPEFQSCVENKEKQQAQQSTKEHPSGLSPVLYARCFADAVHHSHGIITALATIIIGIFTFTLWRATDRLRILAEGQEDAIKKQQRAYLDSGPGGGDGLMATLSDLTAVREKTRIIKGRQIGIRLQVTNHGRTPATLIKMCWHVRPLKNLPREPEYTRWFDAGMKITPGKVFTTRYRLNYDLDWQETYVAYGRIEYTDVFGDAHHHGFLVTIKKNEAGDDFTHPPLRGEYEKYWDES